MRVTILAQEDFVPLAGGSRSRVPPFRRRYADAPAAALLTGLGAGELASQAPLIRPFSHGKFGLKQRVTFFRELLSMPRATIAFDF